MKKILLDIEMVDGTIHRGVRVIMADLIRHAEVAQRHSWPTSLDADPIRGVAFLAYAAMTRLGLYDASKGFETFTKEVAMVSTDEGEGEQTIHPTTPPTTGDFSQL